MSARNVTLAILALTCAAILGCKGGAPQMASATAEAAKVDPKASMEQMMAAWAKYAEPGEGHARLKPLEGKWTYTTRWQMDPSGPAEEGKGTSELTWILGGRFLLQEVRGESSGKPFEGFGLLGYDNLKKRHVSAWSDTMATGLYTSLGEVDETGKVFTFTGEYDDPMTGTVRRSKTVMRLLDNARYTYEAYETRPDGKEMKTFEVVYTRA
ncbi:MAG: DUF1579 domain-containing protein [Planctomycetes bacterium]|nr:DUF1579 domain-containing protein [Planctomycetota bacterium]